MTTIRHLVTSITAVLVAALALAPAAMAQPVNPAQLPGREGDTSTAGPAAAVVHHAAGAASTSVWVFVTLVAITAAASVLLTLAAQHTLRHAQPASAVRMA